LNQQGPGLKHQRRQDETSHKSSSFGQWYDRGAKVAVSTARGFRPGACTNCGAMGHKAKECMERPRKVGAWKTGDVVGVEDVASAPIDLDYAAKHDRWNGYDAAEFQSVVARYQKLDEFRQQAKADAEIKRLRALENPDDAELAAAAAAAAADVADGGDDDDGGGGDGDANDPRTKSTVRNIRNREDTAKYLRNLDVNSAYYDPKTRSMRENPTPNVDPSQSVYQGDNFVRQSGDFKDFASMQRFAWEASEANKGAAAAMVHVANPSQVELLHKQFQEKKATLLQRRRDAILDKYGGAEHLESNQAHEAQLAATERYVEYDAQGRVVKGLEKGKVKSKYDEDVYPGNHTAIWGSHWNAGRWGYRCCHSYVKGSYCLAEAGKRAAAENDLLAAGGAAHDEPQSLMAQLTAMEPEERERIESERRKRHEKEEKERRKRYKEALKEEERHARKRLLGGDQQQDESDRAPYGDQSAVNDISKEHYEAYLQKRYHSEDPMAKYVAEQAEEHEQKRSKKESSSEKSHKKSHKKSKKKK
jgi:pre-mRNA-processing factor SLU7